MSCHIQEVEFGGVKTPAFFCYSDEPDDPEPQVCQFCAAAGELLLCDWPTMKPIEIPVRELVEGDVLTRWHSSTAGSRSRFSRMEIVALAPQKNGIWLVAGEISDKQGRVIKPGSVHKYLWHETCPVRVLRPGTCDAPVCELHAREVGDDRHYCQDHWRDWELVTNLSAK